ncbi:MAG: transketolase [Christensenellales bacterium]|jgi:transketolase
MDKYIKAAAEIRKLTIKAMASAGYGHIGGSMSICDLLAVLYEGVLNIDPENPDKKDRDYVVLSKGHSGPALYAALCYKGYFNEDTLYTLNQGGTRLPSHCDRLKTPGIDLSTGSLGQGISLGIGAALGNLIQGVDSYTYIILGDGELQEGQIWEGVQFMAHHNVYNAVIIVDNNGRQLDGTVEEICRQYDLEKKFSAFGLKAIRINGHNTSEIYDALTAAKNNKCPTAVIMDTEKGYGCSFAEISGFNHYMVITQEMAKEAITEIDRRLNAND